MGTTKPASYFSKAERRQIPALHRRQCHATRSVQIVGKAPASTRCGSGKKQQGCGADKCHLSPDGAGRACNGVIVLSGNSGCAIKAVAAVGSMLRNTHSLLLRPAADEVVSTLANASCRQLLNAARGCLSNPDMPGFRDRCKHNCNRYQKPMAGLLRGFSRRGRA